MINMIQFLSYSHGAQTRSTINYNIIYTNMHMYFKGLNLRAIHNYMYLPGGKISQLF